MNPDYDWIRDNVRCIIRKGYIEIFFRVNQDELCGGRILIIESNYLAQLISNLIVGLYISAVKRKVAPWPTEYEKPEGWFFA